MAKRFFLIVLDSFGVGELPDAHKWHDEGSNTLGAIRNHSNFNCPELERMGLFNIDGVGGGVNAPKASYARMSEKSMGKDTTIGHWEIAGIISPDPLPVYPDGFPKEVIRNSRKRREERLYATSPIRARKSSKITDVNICALARLSSTPRRTACSRLPRTRI